MTRTLVLLLVLLQLPLLPSAAAEEPMATGPDADGAWLLAYDVAPLGSVQARLDVTREDADGTVASARELGTLTFAAPTRHQVSFLPVEGAGLYTVALVLDGAAVGSVRFDVADAGAARTAEFDVPDAPTRLELTADDVNADGKTKSPGDALLTRATLADENGIAELDGVVYLVERAGATVHSGAIPYVANASAVSIALELRYDRSPHAAGEHTMRLRAIKLGAIVAETSRTFVIRDVAPTFVSGALPEAIPDETTTIEGHAVLADKNGAVGPFAIETRVYRGSTRVEGAGFVATLEAPARLADVNGSARWSYPVEVRVPANATPGAHRVSLYANDTLLGSLPFDVRALPVLRSVAASASSGRLVLAVNASGEGILTARLSDGADATTSTSAPIGASNITTLVLDAPRAGVPLTWTVTLRARTGGPALAEREGTWTAPSSGPQLVVAEIHARGRLPAAWSVRAEGWDPALASANVTFTNWDGAPVPAINATYDAGRLRVDAPPTLAAGRYTGRVLLTWQNGSVAEATWSFEAGPWVQLSLGEPIVSGRNATLTLQNVGGLSISRVVVESQPAAALALRAANATLSPQQANGRAHFAGLRLAPGDAAELTVALPEGPLASGRHAIALRVLARVELG